jgi:hypothetical protein
MDQAYFDLVSAKASHAAAVQAACPAIKVAQAGGGDSPLELDAAAGLEILKRQYGHEGGGFNAAAIAALINQGGVTMASILYVTYPPLAAAHKGTGTMVAKVCQSSVQLFGTITDRALYSKQVLRAAGRLDDGQALPDEWVTSPTWFHHSAECYSVVRHNSHLLPYLYAIFNKGGTQSQCYLYDHAADSLAQGGTGFARSATREQCGEYMTPSARREFLNEDTVTHNATNGVDHNLTLRVIKLNGLVNIRANRLQATIIRY